MAYSTFSTSLQAKRERVQNMKSQLREFKNTVDDIFKKILELPVPKTTEDQQVYKGLLLEVIGMRSMMKTHFYEVNEIMDRNVGIVISDNQLTELERGFAEMRSSISKLEGLSRSCEQLSNGKLSEPDIQEELTVESCYTQTKEALTKGFLIFTNTELDFNSEQNRFQKSNEIIAKCTEKFGENLIDQMDDVIPGAKVEITRLVEEFHYMALTRMITEIGSQAAESRDSAEEQDVIGNQQLHHDDL